MGRPLFRCSPQLLADCSPAFSLVSTDREPGTGYKSYAVRRRRNITQVFGKMNKNSKELLFKLILKLLIKRVKRHEICK